MCSSRAKILKLLNDRLELLPNVYNTMYLPVSPISTSCHKSTMAIYVFFFFFFFFFFGFAARQDYFTHFERSQSLGEAKTGDPRQKPPDHPQAELGLSHI